MGSFLSLFSSFVIEHSFLSYGLLFLAVFWEGEIALLTAGILVHLGVFEGWISVPVIILAALAKTLIGYRIGSFLGRVFPNSALLKYLERRILYFLPRFREKPFWSIVVSKCMYGINNIALVFAGYMKADFKKYFFAEMLSSTVWFGGMYGLGYFASGTALSVSHNSKTFSMIILLFVIGIMLALKLIALVVELIEEIRSRVSP